MASEYVVDASIVVSALEGNDTTSVAVHKRIVESVCHAPHLLDAEVGHVLRRSERIGKIGEKHARTALAALPGLIDHRYQHAGPLAKAAWELRHTVTFYDALYVALAAVLGVPLLTADSRLAGAPGLSCEVEVLN